MPSRQDQLHSYQFSVQRVVGALVMRESDPAQSPFRRAAGAMLASVLVALIAVGGAAVYGVFVGGGGTKWRDPSVVIVEKESGARYVYLNEKLHLVLNYASALLIVGAPQPKTVQVSRKSMENVPRGVPLGIVDAPDSLPAANRLSTDPWTICSNLRTEGSDQTPQSALLVGASAGGGTPLGDEGLLARHPNGSLHLIWHNRRHLIRDKELVLDALTWNSQRQVPVAPALLNALPAGADLARIPIQGQGEESEVMDGTDVGDVFVVESQGGSTQYAVAKRDGLANITELQANLLLVDFKQDDPRPLSLTKFADAKKSAQPDLLPGDESAAPASTPKLVAANGSGICARVPGDGGIDEVRTGAALPDLTNVAATAAQGAQGGTLADHVVVGPGRGAVVEAAAAPGASGGAISIITDLGRRHAMTNPNVLAILGYGKVKPIRMPASLVSLVPVGKALDPEAARAPTVRD